MQPGNDERARVGPGVQRALVLAAVWAVTFVAFAGALDAGFVSYDDHMHVVDNAIVRGGWTFDALRFAVTTTSSSNWHPLTWASHITDVELFGLNAGGHHLTSLLLHATNAALLALLIARLTGSLAWSAAAALLYSLHPLRVESVAWISERKDVLSGLFLLLALLAWERWARDRKPVAYAAALAAGALGLMAKPMLVTLPALLLVVDVWPLGRLPLVFTAANARTAARLVVEKLPFFALSLGVSLATLSAQKSAISSFESLPLMWRMENALVAVLRYTGKTVWPEGLVAHYLYPLEPWPRATVLGAAAFFVVVSALAVVLARRARPELLGAWAWVLVSLSPVIGIIMVGSASMADRYTYVPHLLPAVALAVVGARATRTSSRAFGGAILALVVVACAALAVVTSRQVPVWNDSRALFTHVVEVEPENGFAWGGLALAELESGRLVEAEAAARACVKFRGNIADHRDVLGRVLAAKGDHRGAIEQFVESLSLDATRATTHALLAISLLGVGDVANATSEANIARAGRLDKETTRALEQAFRRVSP